MRLSLIALFFTIASYTAIAQTYVKLNTLYAVGGVINPAIELPISDKFSFQSDVAISLWKSIRSGGKNYPMSFGVLQNEIRYHFDEYEQGWYCAFSGGFSVFKMTKPRFLDGEGFGFQNRYSVGHGTILALGGGYKHKINDRWSIDSYLNIGWMFSKYNGYTLDGEIDMEPDRPVQPLYPDPWNTSAEWIPTKAGVAISYRLTK